MAQPGRYVPHQSTQVDPQLIESARRLFEQGEYIEAIEAFTSILEKTENSLARQYLGRCYFRLGKYDTAYKHFSILAKTKEYEDYAKSMLATICALQGNHNEGINSLKKLPKNFNSVINLALLYREQYKIKKEKNLLREAFKLLKELDLKEVPKTSHWRVFLSLALCYQTDKKYTSAKSMFKKALKSTDNNNFKGQILNEYALFFIEQQKLNIAERLLNRASELLSRQNIIEINCNIRYRKILEEKRKKEETDFSNIINDAKNFYYQKDYIKALELFSHILGKREWDLARCYLANCYFHLEKYDEASKHFSILKKSNKYKDYSISMLVTIEAMQGKYSNGIKILKKSPESINNSINLAVLYWLKYQAEGGEWLIHEAKKILNSINIDLVDHQYHWRIYLILGCLYQSEKEYSLAESRFKLALNSTEDELIKGKILNQYGTLFFEKGELDKAEEIFIQAAKYINNRNTFSEGYNAKYRGLIEKKRRNYEKAKEFLDIAAKKFTEQNLYKELAEVNHLLVELKNPTFSFYSMANTFAEALYYENNREKIPVNNARVFDFIINNIYETEKNTP